MGAGYPSVAVGPEAVPPDGVPLASPFQRAIPHADYLMSKWTCPDYAKLYIVGASPVKLRVDEVVVCYLWHEHGVSAAISDPAH